MRVRGRGANRDSTDHRPTADEPEDETTIPRGKVHAYYGAKGGVGTTTLAINTAIALHRYQDATVALVDANLHFGDHRLFLDVGLKRSSIVDACTASAIDEDIVRSVLVTHKSGVDLVLAPTSPVDAEHVSAERHHLLQVIEILRSMYDYVVVDLDKRLDDHTLDVIGTADTLFVVMTADLPSLKNVHLLRETMAQIDVPDSRLELVLNRSNATTGINARSAEMALKRRIQYHVVNDYRTAVGALNGGTPFVSGQPDSSIGKSVRQFATAIGQQEAEPAAAAARKMVPAYG